MTTHEERIDAATKAVYAKYEEYPRVAVKQMNGHLAKDLAEAAITTYLSGDVVAEGWRTIDSVPVRQSDEEDPERVLLWVKNGGPNGRGVATFGHCYRRNNGSIRTAAIGFYGDWEITHWMRFNPPLPAGPEAGR